MDVHFIQVEHAVTNNNDPGHLAEPGTQSRALLSNQAFSFLPSSLPVYWPLGCGCTEVYVVAVATTRLYH